MMAQSYCLMMRVELQAGRPDKCLKYAVNVAGMLKEACRGLFSYPNFVNPFVKMLIELAPLRNLTSELLELLNIVDGDNSEWLQSIDIVEILQWNMSLSIAYEVIGLKDKSSKHD